MPDAVHLVQSIFVSFVISTSLGLLFNCTDIKVILLFTAMLTRRFMKYHPDPINTEISTTKSSLESFIMRLENPNSVLRIQVDKIINSIAVTAIGGWIGGFLLPLDWQVFYVQFPFPVIAGLLIGESISLTME